MKILSVVGARPEFIQAMPVSRILRENHREVLVHTGQHYDYRMSQVFFDDLDIPVPDYNLEVGSGSHAQQTAQMMVRMEEVLLKEEPDLVIVRGDTNSTLAGMLAACKLNIPIAHIEAGERSFNRNMPEEINRLLVDRLAHYLFCVSQTAVEHLRNEGIETGVFWVGDVMLDAIKISLSIAQAKSKLLDKLSLIPKRYSLVTVHRSGNTDDPERMKQIIEALNRSQEIIVFPVHPRTRKILKELDIPFENHVRMVEPVGYLDMIMLEENARLIATDSGGIQREAYFLEIPCLTLRDETEWTNTVAAGWNKLVGADADRIAESWFSFHPSQEHPNLFGDGNAAFRIVDVIDNSVINESERLYSAAASAGRNQVIERSL